MLIGVTGDTHNNLKNISKICDLFNEADPSFVIHTGDITLPKSLAAFSKLKMPLIGVFGNNDEFEKKGLIEEAKKFDCDFFDEPHTLEINEKKIIKSFEFMPICPKKKGFKSVIKQVKIATFELNNFFENINNPTILNVEKDIFTKCIIKSIFSM